jgi:hypothetical protein
MRFYTQLSHCSDYRDSKASLSEVLHLSATANLPLYIWLPDSIELSLRHSAYSEQIKHTYLAVGSWEAKRLEYLAGALVSENDEGVFLSTEIAMKDFKFDLRSFFGVAGFTKLFPEAKGLMAGGPAPTMKHRDVHANSDQIQFKIGQLFFFCNDLESAKTERLKLLKGATGCPPKADQLDPRKEKTYLQIIRAMSLALDLPQQPYKAAEVLQTIAAQHRVELPKKLDTIAKKIEEARKLSE